MSKLSGKIDLAKFREVTEEQRRQARRGPEGHIIRQRAVIRLVEDQLKVARSSYPLIVKLPGASGIDRTMRPVGPLRSMYVDVGRPGGLGLTLNTYRSVRAHLNRDCVGV